ncbi:MAG: TIGR02281 family clan AA aspartic protease [Cohaesibacteraceae bacterium]|nr:TIGR02281 family clan AA aspartic protease [Cohaesibacteraceae bacterium]
MIRLLVMAFVCAGVFASVPMFLKEFIKSEPARAGTEKTAGLAASQRHGVIKASANGNFYAKAIINGRPVEVIVDTGASVVSLPFEIAKRIGIPVHSLKYNRILNTANGKIRCASAMLRDVQVKGITRRKISAVVCPKGTSDFTLLGMSWLRKLKKMEIRGRSLLLEG